MLDHFSNHIGHSTRLGSQRPKDNAKSLSEKGLSISQISYGTVWQNTDAFESSIQSHRAPVLRETHLRKQRVDSRTLATS